VPETVIIMVVFFCSECFFFHCSRLYCFHFPPAPDSVTLKMEVVCTCGMLGRNFLNGVRNPIQPPIIITTFNLKTNSNLQIAVHEFYITAPVKSYGDSEQCLWKICILVWWTFCNVL
jgi:hypothetical protein